MADDPNNKTDLKIFHGEIQNDHEALKLEASNYQTISDVRNINLQTIMVNYHRIKEDIKELIDRTIII